MTKVKLQAKAQPVSDINPNDTFKIEEIEKAKEVLKQSDRNNTSALECPYKLLPKEVQQIIEDCDKFHHHQTDFLTMSMLCTVSQSIGNMLLYESVLGYQDHALMYMVMVGDPGIGKSHPIKWALKPFYNRDDQEYERYEKFILDNGADRSKVDFKKLVMKDFTIENLKKQARNNPRGQIIHIDELKKFFEDGRRYNGAGFDDDFTQIFSRDTLDNNRNGSGWIRMKSLFTNIIGTTQPGNLRHFFGHGRLESGLTDRFLFIYPEKPTKRDLVLQQIPVWHYQKWEEIIYKILDFKFVNASDNQEVLYNLTTFTEEAQTAYIEYVNKFIRQESQTVEALVSNAYSKLETYIGRFALTVNTLRWACNEKGVTLTTIDKTSVNIATQFVEYIKSHILKVHEIEIVRNPTTKLRDWQKILFDAIEKYCDEHRRNSFKLEEALVLGMQLQETTKKKGFSRRSICDFLRNDKLFKSDNKGTYFLIG